MQACTSEDIPPPTIESNITKVFLISATLSSVNSSGRTVATSAVYATFDVELFVSAFKKLAPDTAETAKKSVLVVKPSAPPLFLFFDPSVQATVPNDRAVATVMVAIVVNNFLFIIFFSF